MDERKPPRAFPPPPPEYRDGRAPSRPPVAICLYDRARRTEQWHSMVGTIRWVNQGAEHIAIIGHDVGDLRIAITLEVTALVEAFDRARREQADRLAAAGKPASGGGKAGAK